MSDVSNFRGGGGSFGGGGASGSWSNEVDNDSPPALQIALSPLQLAAVLEDGTLNEAETLSNRLWGGVKLLGGALELVGAAALLLVPEPTMATKVGGGVLGAHGVDTAGTALEQIWTGREKTTLTAQAAEAAARSMGLDPDNAATVGTAVDIAVPLVAGFVGALRVIAVRAGRISLAAEDAAGGHTISRAGVPTHVGLTEAQLRARLSTLPKSADAASTFANLADAEKFVSAAMRANKLMIKSWAASAPVGARLAVPSYNAGTVVGNGVIRATGKLEKMTKVKVVLKKVAHSGKRIFFVLTSYPEP